MENHSYDGNAGNTGPRQTSSAQPHEGTMEGKLLLLYRKKEEAQGNSHPESFLAREE